MSTCNARQHNSTKHKKTPRGQRRTQAFGETPEQQAYNSNSIGFKNKLVIRDIEPLTDNQRVVFDSYDDGHNLFLHGYPGTGKSFLAFFLSLQEILDGDSPYDKVIVVRSTVPSRDQGFMPGKKAEKEAVYEDPYIQICDELFGRSDAYGLLKTKGVIEFTSTSFLRGVTFKHAIVIVDEVQNSVPGELHTVISRVGENCRIIFCGDIRQNDLLHAREKSGIADFMKVIKKMRIFDFMEFGIDDIVRSNLVKQYIITRCEMEDSGEIQSLL
ncbi:MAG: PhoH family protein [Legionella sp.]|uniref:PhoH family protein n=1 Tax=Legionella sp. TaxID=459 RepID=UPI0028402442|nr:PhoH family protein [Legionella sp.]